MNANSKILASRHAACASKAAQDHEVLVAHQRIAERLRLASSDEVAGLLHRALAQVALWERAGLCHSRYIEAWRHLLNEPVGALRAAMVCEGPEGVALRQDTPFGFALSTP